MRIREITFNNVRAFRGEHRISFVDPLTDEVNPVTVIAGTNGTGKTTIIEAIVALLQFALNLEIPLGSLLDELANDGFVSLTLELSALDVSEDESFETQKLHLMVGKRELAPKELPPQTLYCLSTFPQPGFAIPRFGGELLLRQQFIKKVYNMQTGQTPLRGGLLYFPQTRALAAPTHDEGISVQEQPRPNQWLARLTPPTQWQGSLEAFWVWQNYLDLEAQVAGRSTTHLKPFIQTIEEVLGEKRRISIKEGRVLVPAALPQNGGEALKVLINQLPSGEQQCLFLLGELARWRRSGAAILIDEPETSLHPTLQRLLMYQLRKLAREWDCQLILATHSLEVLRSVHESQRINLDHLEALPETAESSLEEAR